MGITRICLTLVLFCLLVSSAKTEVSVTLFIKEDQNQLTLLTLDYDLLWQDCYFSNKTSLVVLFIV